MIREFSDEIIRLKQMLAQMTWGKMVINEMGGGGNEVDDSGNKFINVVCDAKMKEIEDKIEAEKKML